MNASTLILLLGVVFLSGCGAWDRFSASVTGATARICVDGVLYLQFTSGASVAYSRDGKIRTCD